MHLTERHAVPLRGFDTVWLARDPSKTAPIRRQFTAARPFTDIYVKNIYLNDRKPVVIFSNVASIIPQTYLDGDKQGQIRRAAEVIVALLDAKMLIE
ncbi:carnitine O-acetyltransferase-like protein, partial [Lates japonicus]